MLYEIVDTPAFVRNSPSASSKIVNALDVGTKVEIDSEKNGWLKMITGNYILKSKNIKEYIFKNMLEYNKYKSNIKNFEFGLQVFANVITTGSTAKIKSVGTYTTDGNYIDDSYANTGTLLSVTNISEDGNTVTLTDATTNQTFTVASTSIIYQDNSGKWSEVDPAAYQQQQTDNSIVSFVKSSVLGIGNGNDENNVSNMMNSLDTQTMSGIFGLPYQYMPTVDRRLDGSESLNTFGRVYAEKIGARMNTILLQPGVPDFMQGYSSSDTSSILSSLKNSMSSSDNSDLGKLLNNSGKYYALKVKYDDYFNCVNQPCWAAATLLGIQDTVVTIGGVTDKLGSFNWLHNSATKAFGYDAGTVAFYVNAEPQVSESFSNSTTQSQMAAKINQIGDIGREIQFLLGGVSNVTGENALGIASTLTGAGSQEAKANKANESHGPLGAILGGIQTLLSGGKMIFPEIWQDSSCSRSYSLTVKLDSPDCDNVSIYLNIIVPLLHLLAFVQPRHIGSNTYISPYLVRAFYKSTFHIDMGIITDMQIQKGEELAWTTDGLPTQIVVQFTIKDLYDTLAMSICHGLNDLLSNPFQLDYISSLCGINIAEPDAYRTIALWSLLRNPANRIPSAVTNWGSQVLTNVYARFNNVTNSDFTM